MENNSSKKILIVDDESEMRIALETTLKREDYQLVCAEDGKQALDLFEDDAFDLVLTDVRMPKLSGLELLRAVKERSPKIPVVMMTAYGTIDNAVEAMKEGAFDYLIKGSGFSADVLVSTVKRAFLNPQDYVPPVRPMGFIDKADSIITKKIVTQNEEMKKLLKFAENVAYSKSTVLIMGETGTGKELFARYIHQCSPRAGKAFMAVNCAALPEGLLESELFGHEKGSFTGATENKEGKFQQAHQSSLLLDEITEMGLPLQAKLLRVLQEHEVDKVGGKAPIPVDVRVIATTNSDVRRRIQDQEFREDLYYRLNVIPLNLIPLRERKDDIPILAEHFMNQFCQENSRSPVKMDPATLALLKKYSWPGNIRELGNIIERTCLMCQGDTLLPAHLFFDDEPLSSGKNAAGARLTGTISEMEKELILQTLKEFSDNKTKAAESLGISIRTLRNKLNEYNEGE
ncbi:MAG: sigma-54-dependent Fis family transcriptional regulator [Nitrospina sp.]|jgi:DNA-binding NtrC family response regulator|nr:sigma-54-dependent Fis family transcriptional regulator [Nitrospina sp.]MBT3415714.1 sigma-54-dependent Fis family transcriptional regulator [Nitrospina sp.]MBT3856709.1 sigma-54-dependent Fis family transcriptional regulator [Nitrospina sp.]MBT4105354.1 sigma-54-dependent Fis family transcriptional regulator [Nitrospina sp.]MBT4390654.1 sigma-54-dependent Fis family transcriptional regulator [Nitrospina sp.]